MKKQFFFKTLAVAAIFFFACTNLVAQGNFVFRNTSPITLQVELFADYDTCTGSALCASGAVLIAPGSSHTFNTCTSNGAWKYMDVTDGCGSVRVGETGPGICANPTSGTFTDCSSNTRTITWINENSGRGN